MNRRWTPEEDAMLREMHPTKTQIEMAAILGRRQAAIRTRCWTLGLNGKGHPWSQEEIDGLRAAYRAAISREFAVLATYAAKIGREFSNVSRKARSMGLTTYYRPFKLNPKGERPPKFGRRNSQELREAQCKIAKESIAKFGHPRGALGMKHTPESKAAIGKKNRANWADPNSAFNSQAARHKRSDNMLKRILSGKMNSGYSRCRMGRRPDLDNRFFRSGWEANYARYLNFLKGRGEIVDWEYEPQTFIFESIKRGNRSYTPDFKVILDASGRYEWHEVKGWMDNNSRVRLSRMGRFFPDEVVKVIGQGWFRQATRGGLANILPGWERDGKRKASTLPLITENVE